MNRQQDFWGRSLALAHAQAMQGMTQALAHAEETTPGWGTRAFAFLTAYAQTHRYFAAFEVTAAALADPTFPVPPTDKSWGHPYLRALSEGVLVVDNDADQPMRHPRRHGSKCDRYRSLVYQGAFNDRPTNEGGQP